MNLNLGNYLNRLNGSDIAMSNLEKKLLDSDRPTLLFHFGDHQPSFDGAMRTLDKNLPGCRRRSEFHHVLHAQDQLHDSAQVRRGGDWTSASPPSLILDVAGVKKDEFFAGECADARTLRRLLPELREEAAARLVSQLPLLSARGVARMNVRAHESGARATADRRCRRSRAWTAGGARRDRRGHPRCEQAAHQRTGRLESAQPQAARNARRAHPRARASRSASSRSMSTRSTASTSSRRPCSAWRARSRSCRRRPMMALIDGNQLPRNLPCAARAIVDGDALEPVISAASILAKVARDRLMYGELDAEHPGYGFARHKGYANRRTPRGDRTPRPVRRITAAASCRSSRCNSRSADDDAARNPHAGRPARNDADSGPLIGPPGAGFRPTAQRADARRCAPRVKRFFHFAAPGRESLAAPGARRYSRGTARFPP